MKSLNEFITEQKGTAAITPDDLDIYINYKSGKASSTEVSAKENEVIKNLNNFNAELSKDNLDMCINDDDCIKYTLNIYELDYTYVYDENYNTYEQELDLTLNADDSDITGSMNIYIHIDTDKSLNITNFECKSEGKQIKLDNNIKKLYNEANHNLYGIISYIYNKFIDMNIFNDCFTYNMN